MLKYSGLSVSSPPPANIGPMIQPSIHTASATARMSLSRPATQTVPPASTRPTNPPPTIQVSRFWSLSACRNAASRIRTSVCDVA